MLVCGDGAGVLRRAGELAELGEAALTGGPPAPPACPLSVVRPSACPRVWPRAA